MEIQLNNLRDSLTARFAASVAIAALFIASNVNPSPIPAAPQESTICVPASDRTGARIQYSKGRIDFIAHNPEQHMIGVRKLVSGDRIHTGADGFVSIIFSDGRYINIQPDSKVQLLYSSACGDHEATKIEPVTLDTAYLTAAIRG